MNWLRGLSWQKRLGVLGGAFFGLFVVFVGLGYAFTDVPTPNKIATDQATRILYSDGGELGRIGKNRQIVSLSEISPAAQKAVLAAEDRNFYSEPGISAKGIARALFTNLKGGGVTQGGSTITQQYAKNAFLTQERTFTRKVKEVFIAVKMSQTVSKDTILQDYLNTIYFGRGAYGIEAASEAYFRVRAKDLKPTQAAVLASSIRSPAAYDPARHPERAKIRWNYVLDGMVKQGWLDQDERQAATYPRIAKPGISNFPGPLDGIREQVVAELEKHGFPEDRIAAGGLTVQTTVTRGAQEAATAAVERYIKPSSRKNPPVGALVAVQPGTGKVIAYYGNRKPGGFDYASDGKGVQPGSSMKPYVLAAALQEGISLSTTYNGANHQDICGQQDVKNDAGDPPFGQIDLATALEHSVNTVYFRLACDVGPKNVAAVAHAAGIPDSALKGEGTLSAQIALGSGGYEIHPIDQATGFATFAANGTAAKPYFVQRVLDGKDEIYRATAVTSRAFSKDVAADATYAMQKVVTGGTGTRAKLAGRPTAGKTGTTTNNTNAWFAGFTPQLAAAVWVGREGGLPLKGVLGIEGGVYGGRFPAQIFKAFMDAALEGQPAESFPERANVGAPATPSVTPSVSATPSPTPSATPSATPTAVVTVPPVVPTTPPPTSASPAPSPLPSKTASPAASP